MSAPDAKPEEAPLVELLARTSRENDIPLSRRVFVNRNLRMDGIDLIGFDMDYTIAVYHQAEMERLSIELTLKKLVEKRGFPREILSLEYHSEWAIRGLVVDRLQGNVLKMDRHGHVGRVFHGMQPLARAEREAYRKERVRMSTPRYAGIDTLFALPEVVVYGRLVEHMKPADSEAFGKLWRDVRECIDEAHRDDTLKSVIRADLTRFLDEDTELAMTLHKFRSSGKRLFLLTNSLWDYTDPVMRHLLDGRLPAYPSWRSYFDIIIVGGAKPAFFTDRQPFVELDVSTGQPVGTVKGETLLRGHLYQGGNLLDFEKMAGASGDRVLYVGDHIYGDILRAKKSSVWRTAMIVQELEQEIQVSERQRRLIVGIDELDRKRRNLDSEIDFQQLLLKSLQDGKTEKNVPPGMTVDEAKREAKRTLDALRADLRKSIEDLENLEEQVDRAYNPHWGPIFREGNESSRFGEQVEDYACVYTSRVSNFLRYSPLRYFRAPRVQLPHET